MLAHLSGDEFGFLVIDMDEFLEKLPGSAQEFNADLRHACSREVDKEFEEAVINPQPE